MRTPGFHFIGLLAQQVSTIIEYYFPVLPIVLAENLSFEYRELVMGRNEGLSFNVEINKPNYLYPV